MRPWMQNILLFSCSRWSVMLASDWLYSGPGCSLTTPGFSAQTWQWLTSMEWWLWCWQSTLDSVSRKRRELCPWNIRKVFGIWSVEIFLISYFHNHLIVKVFCSTVWCLFWVLTTLTLVWCSEKCGRRTGRPGCTGQSSGDNALIMVSSWQWTSGKQELKSCLVNVKEECQLPKSLSGWHSGQQWPWQTLSMTRSLAQASPALPSM